VAQATVHYLAARDIVLVQPPQRGLLNGFANALMDLGNFVIQRTPSAHVCILDLAFARRSELDEHARRLVRGCHRGLVVGITTTTASYQAALQTAAAFKAAAPDCLVVFGGHHASPQHEVVLRRHRRIVDAVVRGEGEYALLALARGEPLAKVPSLSFLHGERLVANPPPPRLSENDLDSLPPAYEFDILASAAGKFDHATYVSARGCPLRCSFCAVAGQKTVAKSIATVIRDLDQLVRERGFRRIAIEDNFFAQKQQRTIDLCHEIARLRESSGIPFTWDCQTRVESMSPEVLRAFEMAGCEAAYLGVDSLVEEELDYLKKSTNPSRYLERVTTTVSRMAGTSVACYLNLQVGLPGETDSHRGVRLQRLAELGQIAARHRRTITVFPQLHVVYPGTDHFNRAIQEADFGDRGRGYDIFEAFTEWESHEEPILRFLGENFAHGVGGIPVGILDRASLRNADLEERFVVRHDHVERLREHLADLDKLEGIEVFKYGSHLVRALNTLPRTQNEHDFMLEPHMGA
jgi:radical SAM superfamily enzyme YgiQ (UPF0313 family)